jgi:hypothetical protein
MDGLKPPKVTTLLPSKKFDIDIRIHRDITFFNISSYMKNISKNIIITVIIYLIVNFTKNNRNFNINLQFDFNLQVCLHMISENCQYESKCFEKTIQLFDNEIPRKIRTNQQDQLQLRIKVHLSRNERKQKLVNSSAQQRTLSQAAAIYSSLSPFKNALIGTVHLLLSEECTMNKFNRSLSLSSSPMPTQRNAKFSRVISGPPRQKTMILTGGPTVDSRLCKAPLARATVLVTFAATILSVWLDMISENCQYADELRQTTLATQANASALQLMMTRQDRTDATLRALQNKSKQAASSNNDVS